MKKVTNERKICMRDKIVKYNDVKDRLFYFRADGDAENQNVICGRFIHCKIDKRTVPKDLYVYECRFEEKKGVNILTSIEPSVSENLFGTLLLDCKLTFKPGANKKVTVKNVSITSKRKIKRVYAGTIKINSEEVDVTDPCYDKDVWCRTKVKIHPGTYECYADFADFNLWGNRCMRCYIVNNAPALKEKALKGLKKSRRFKGSIGVDAGMAGFFDDKPDFDDSEWSTFCDYTFAEEEKGKQTFIRQFETGDGFWTTSGFGDGGYDVYTASYGDKAIGVMIEFIPENEED